jgi:hypothetical protein
MAVRRTEFGCGNSSFTATARRARACATAVRFGTTGCKVQLALNPCASCPGLSRASTPRDHHELQAFVRTRRCRNKLSKLSASARRGCPGQARARRVRVVNDLNFTTGLAEPGSRGLVPAIHAATSQTLSRWRYREDGRSKSSHDGGGVRGSDCAAVGRLFAACGRAWGQAVENAALVMRRRGRAARRAGRATRLRPQP